MRIPRIVFVLATCVALFTPRAGLATVNIEKYRLALQDDGATGSLSLGVAAKTGNVDYFETSLSGTAGARFADNLLLLVVSGKYAAKRTGDDRLETPGGSLLDSDARYANKLLGAARYNRDLAKRWTWELFGQVEYDEFLRLDLRALGGTGPRLALATAEDAVVYVGTAYMLEYEGQAPDLVVEDPTTLAHRWSSYVSFVVTPLDSLELSATAYIQPRITDFSDFRIYNESELSVAITDHFSLGIAFTLRHDSDPARLVEGEPPLQPTDTTLTNKLSVGF